MDVQGAGHLYNKLYLYRYYPGDKKLYCPVAGVSLVMCMLKIYKVLKVMTLFFKIFILTFYANLSIGIYIARFK